MYRGNPDFLAGELSAVEEWLASSYVEGWSGNWLTDLDDPRAPAWGARLRWSVDVQAPRDSGLPAMVKTKALTAAANAGLLAYLERLQRAEEKGRLREAIGLEVPVDLAVEIVNRALGRGPAELESTRRLVGLGRDSAAPA